MADRIQLRRGTAAQWTSVNTILLSGEFGHETDTNKFKVGDGSTAWNSLPYANKTTNASELTSGTLPDARLSAKVKSLADLATPASTQLLAMNSSGLVVDGSSLLREAFSIAGVGSSTADLSRASLVLGSNAVQNTTDLNSFFVTIGQSKIVRFLPGTYEFNGSVNIPAGTKLSGLGATISNKSTTERIFTAGGIDVNNRIAKVQFRDFYFVNSTHGSQAIRIEFADDCLVENVFVEANGSSTGGAAVSLQHVYNSRFANIRMDDSPATASVVFGLAIFDCEFFNIKGNGGQEIIDFSGVRRCVIDGVVGKNCSEGMDLGNVSDCVFTNIVLDNVANGIRLKTEITGTFPVNEGYGSNRNVFRNVTVRNYTATGIGFVAGGAAAESQKIDDNSFSDVVLRSASNTVVESFVIVNGDDSTNNFNSGVRLTNVSITSNSGDGIRWTLLRDAVLDNVTIKVPGICITHNAPSVTADACRNNTFSKLKCTRTTTTGPCVLLRHHDGLYINNSEFYGGNDAMLIADHARVEISSSIFGSCTANGISSQWLSVDRRYADRVDFHLRDIVIRNFNSSNGFNWPIRFFADTSVYPAIKAITTNYRVEDTTNNTAREVQYLASSGAPYSDCQSIGDYHYGLTPAIPPGSGSRIVNFTTTP